MAARSCGSTRSGLERRAQATGCRSPVSVRHRQPGARIFKSLPILPSHHNCWYVLPLHHPPTILTRVIAGSVTLHMIITRAGIFQTLLFFLFITIAGTSCIFAALRYIDQSYRRSSYIIARAGIFQLHHIDFSPHSSLSTINYSPHRDMRCDFRRSCSATGTSTVSAGSHSL